MYKYFNREILIHISEFVLLYILDNMLPAILFFTIQMSNTDTHLPGLIEYLVIYGFILWFAIHVYHKETGQKVSLNWHVNWRHYLSFGSLILLGIYFINNGFSILSNTVYKASQSANNASIRTFLNMVKDNPFVAIVSITSIMILMPILEEYIYRGVLANIFNISIWWICLINGIIFASAHGFSNIILSLSYVIMGMVLCYIYKKSNNLLPSILLHIGNNMIDMIIILIQIYFIK